MTVAGKRRGMLEMRVARLTVDPLTNMPIVLLRDVATGSEEVPIGIGLAEASAIAAELEQVTLERPMAHDLIKTIIGQAGMRVDRIEVHDVRAETFFAKIVLVDGDKKEMAIEARPSDALAVALRCGARIQVARKVMRAAKRLGQPSPMAIGILEQLDDEDFGKWKM